MELEECEAAKDCWVKVGAVKTPEIAGTTCCPER